MKFIKTQPKEGDIRPRDAFLWLPKTINGETRWLEHAFWYERYTSVVTSWEYGCAEEGHFWIEERWA